MEENNGDVAENLFEEMEVDKQKPKQFVEQESVIGEEFVLEGKTRKQLVARLRENSKIKTELSKQINDLIKKRKDLIKENIALRNKYVEMAKKE